jgi:sulfite exporter TauE/SafE
MPAIETVNTAAGAIAAGLASSLHCAGMCGPLACSLMTLKGSPQHRGQAAGLYHAGRALSYGLIGVLAGALGRWPLENLTGRPLLVLPWILALVLLGMALGLHVRIPRPAIIKRWSARARLRLCRIPLRRGAFAMGMATPLLPCGPLYLMAGIALASGSAIRGAEFMLAFCMGTMPLLWFAQHRFHAWKQSLGPVAMNRVRKAVCVAGAAVLLLRLWPAVSAKDEGAAAAAPPACPFCQDK